MRNLSSLIPVILIACSLCISTSATAENKPKKDRGTASVMIGDNLWEATSCRPKLRESGSLKLTCSRSNYSGGKARRQSIDVVLENYSGPGEYEANHFSFFIGVGIDTDAMKKAEGDDSATQKEVMSAISGSSRIRMQGARFVIDSANDREITGTFSLPARAASPAMTQGEFRAVFRQK